MEKFTFINTDTREMTNRLDNQVTVFFDTMVFIHCVPIQDIDLHALLGAENIKVVIPRITIQELDKHKNTHSSQRIRKRAAQRLKDISSWGEAHPSEIRSGVTISLVMCRPAYDFFKEGLDREWADDQLIAAVLDHKESHAADRVVLISHDVGPKFTALQFGIETAEIPDKWRIPPEDDPLVKENRRLRNELLIIQNSQPKLILRLSEMQDDEEHISYRISRSEPIEPPDKNAIIARLKESYPELNYRLRKSVQKDSFSKTIAMIGKSQFGEIHPSEYERYNRDRLEFFSNYAGYLDRLMAYRTQPDRTIRLHMEVRNIGKTPADDVDVYIHFPDGFSLYTEDNLPGEPADPSPPDEPRSDGEKMLASMKWSSRFPDFRPPSISRETFSLRRTNSYELKEHYDRIKHGYLMRIRPIFIVFSSFDEADSFSFTYELNIGNLPNLETGKISVVIEK